MAIDPLSLGFLAFLLSLGKKGGSKSESKSSNHGSPGKAKISTPQELLSRATQPRAMAWAVYFQDVGEIPAIADALARWSGIESGGDPTIESTLGERGLLQVGKQTQAEGGISAQDWAELIDKSTVPNEHARIGAHYWHWLFTRAAKHLSNPPDDSHSIDQIWYAYHYHQRPKDFTQWGELPNSAPAASAFLMAKSRDKNDAQLAKRVTASNVVAFGTPDAPLTSPGA